MNADLSGTPQQLFRRRCREWAERPALRHKRRGIWQTVTWGGYYAQARAAGLALAALGARAGDRVSVLSENRPEWLYADAGARCMGMIGNGLYPTSSPEQVEYLLNDSGTRVLFAENDEQLDKVLAVRGRCPALEWTVLFDAAGLRGLDDPRVLTWEAFLARGRELDFDAAIDAGRPQDTAFLVYTSGTTGQPKGAMITNANAAFQIACAPHIAELGPRDRTLSFLPLCHIAERITTAFLPLWGGNIVHFPESVQTVFHDLREVEPQLVFAPPRFWEKLHAQVELFMRDAAAPARWAYARGLCLGNVRRLLGLDRLRYALTGAAPVPPELPAWYRRIGIELLEAFGMTETSGLCTATPRGAGRPGFAGVPPAGVSLRLGAGGEILVRGPNVFAGYWKKPEQTAQAIDAEGWLHTGDVGELGADGWLGVRDRLKDILITSGGKNVSPSEIENRLKMSPYIADAMVIGDGRRYLTCLVMLDQDSVARFAQERQVPYTDFASLARSAEVAALVRAELERVNATLARAETVKDFRVIEALLSAEDEELTPTMKLKRRVVAHKYAALIATMYPE
jgi:long-chain acyl-CoA synthetase